MTDKAVPIGKVDPFFQVVVFADDRSVAISLDREIQAAIDARKRKAASFDIRGSEESDGVQYVHVVHSYDPSWVNGRTEVKNIEHDEVMLFRDRGWTFLHSNCDALMDMMTSALGRKLHLASAADIERVLALRGPEIRCLGMHNLFTPGGTAPEAKTHFARDAASTLSPLNDSVYGMKYCFAAEPPAKKGEKAKPLGCSVPKRKIWRTRAGSVAAFRKECVKLAKDLSAKGSADMGWVLARRIATPPAGIEPIAFYADYNIDRRGVLWIEAAGGLSHDWAAYLLDSKTARFEVRSANGQESTDVVLTCTQTGVSLDYAPGAAVRSVIVCGEGEPVERRRSKDLIEFLNEEGTFTTVFTKGVAYRDGFWKDESLELTFSRAQSTIPWRGIDIRKESLRDGSTDTIGDAILAHAKTLAWPQVVICDDGANEVADYILLGDKRIAMVHAKFSCKKSVGLRAKDLQEVLSQTHKNLRNFRWRALEPHVQRLRERVLSAPARADIADLLRATCENQRTQRECWIVQPGISASALAADKGNKIHALLNHTDSACRAGNVAFVFYCSS